MRDTLISLISLFAAILLLMLGNGLLGSLLGLKLAESGAPPLAAGLVMTGYYSGLILGALTGERIIRRVGHIRAFAAFGALNCALIMLLALIGASLAWTLLRLGMGLAMMGLYMVVESWLNERAERSIRGRVFSIYMVTTYVGLGGGQFLLGLDESGSLRLFLLAGLLFALCLMPVALTRAAHPAPVQAQPFNLRALWRRAPYGVLGCFGAGLVNGAFYALGPAYIYAQVTTASVVAIFMGFTIFGGVVLQWPIGLLSDRYDRRGVLALLHVAVAAVSLLVLLAGGNLLWLMGAALLWGGIAFTVYPVAVAHANDHIEPEQTVPASGALILANSAGAATGPLAGALAMHWLGAAGLYLFAATVSLLLAGAVAWRRDREPVSIEEQSPYIPVPRTSQVIAQLDPRLEENAEEPVPPVR